MGAYSCGRFIHHLTTPDCFASSFICHPCWHSDWLVLMDVCPCNVCPSCSVPVHCDVILLRRLKEAQPQLSEAERLMSMQAEADSAASKEEGLLYFAGEATDDFDTQQVSRGGHNSSTRMEGGASHVNQRHINMSAVVARLSATITDASQGVAISNPRSSCDAHVH